MPKCLYCSGVTDEPGKYEKTNIAKIKVNAPNVYLVANWALSLFRLWLSDLINLFFILSLEAFSDLSKVF